MGDSYTDGNRAFTQSMMSHGTLTFKQAQPIIAQILSYGDVRQLEPEEVQMRHFEDFIAKTAHAISRHEYQIRSAVDQRTGERVWAWVNSTSDSLTQVATTLAADELSFVKRVLDAIFDRYNTQRMEKMCVTMAEAINLSHPPRRRRREEENGDEEPQPSNDRGLKHSDVQRVMNEMVGGGWFVESKDKFFTVSPRALMELRTWLFETYNDPDLGPDEWQRIKTCVACKEIVTWGQRCSEPFCNVRLHDCCADKFWAARRGKVCPKCQTEWKADKFVGERAITMTKAYQDARGQSRGGRRSTLASDIFNEANRGLEEDEEEDEDEDEDVMA